MSGRRVVVTGLGVIAPNGIGKEAYWTALMAGKNAVGPTTRFDASRLSSRMSGEVRDFVPDPRIPERDLRVMDRAYQMGVTAAWMAFDDAGLDASQWDAERTGVYMGLAVAAADRHSNDFHHWRHDKPETIQAHWYQSWFPSACSGYISLVLGLRGSSQVVSTGCCASPDAVGLAFDAIRAGREEMALAGGCEAPLTPLMVNAFCAMRALSTRNDDPTHASRPFDKERDGFIIAEGGGVLVLESLEHAQARGARIYAEVKGYGTTSNAYHMTAPDPSGEQTARGLRLALEDAELPPESIDVILTHGSSTPLNEKAETLAIKKAMGDHARRLMIPSIKSMIGHPLGSAGALQIITAALCVDRQGVPPTINYQVPDPDCDLDCVPNQGRWRPLANVLVNTAGFSGKNSATLLGALQN